MSEPVQYNYLAQLYDRLMNHVNYKVWAGYIAEIAAPYLPHSSSILEVAAGTGKFASYFSEIYPNLVLSDISFPMLQVAAAKSDDPLVNADFRSLPFRNGSFDGVICLYDSINYMLDPEDVQKTITEVGRVLQQGGIFIFDCCLISGSRAHAQMGNRTEHYRGVELTQYSYRIEAKNVHINTFYIKHSTGEVSQETHRQKIYRLSFFKKTLEANGFEILHCYDNDSFSEATEKSFRAHFLVRKL